MNDLDLGEIWLDPDYVEYRRKVQGFGFAPCTYCGGCDLSEAMMRTASGTASPPAGAAYGPRA